MGMKLDGHEMCEECVLHQVEYDLFSAMFVMHIHTHPDRRDIVDNLIPPFHKRCVQMAPLKKCLYIR